MQCTAGYEPDEANQCADIDECKSEPPVCSALARCENEAGSYSCHCLGYYEDVNGDGSSCVDNRLLDSAVFGDNWDKSAVRDVAFDGRDMFLAGDFQRELTLGDTTLVSAGPYESYDAFVAKLKGEPLARGEFESVWSKRFGNTGEDRAVRVRVDPRGDAIVIGMFQGSLDLGGPMPLMAQGRSGFVAKLAGADGSVRWQHTTPLASPLDLHDDWPTALGVDALGNVYVAGRFSGSTNPSDDFPSAPESIVDMFVAQYTRPVTWAGSCRYRQNTSRARQASMWTRPAI